MVNGRQTRTAAFPESFSSRSEVGLANGRSLARISIATLLLLGIFGEHPAGPPDRHAGDGFALAVALSGFFRAKRSPPRPSCGAAAAPNPIEVLDFAADGIVTINESSIMESVNRSVERTFGYAREELIGKNVSILMMPQDAICHDRHVASYIATGHGRIIGIGPREVTGRRKDGTPIPLELAVSEMRSEGRRIFIGSLRDLTSTKRIAEALRQSEARFRDFAEIVSDWFWEQDENHRFNYMSPSFEQKTGIRVEEVLGRKREDVIVFASEAARLQYHVSINAHLSFTGIRVILQLPDGRRMPVSISGRPIMGPAGVFQGYRGVARDLSAETSAEAAVIAARQQFDEAVEAMSDGLAVFDADDRLLMCNRRFLETFPRIDGYLKPGVVYQELMVRLWQCGQFADRRDSLPDWISQALRWHAAPSGEILQQLADGRWLKLVERRTPGGGTVLVATDVTEIKAREVAFARAKSEAEQASELKTSFLANMSHELRTPLNAIIGFSEIMESEMLGPLGSARYRGYVGNILESGRHLVDLINDLLDISKLGAGRREIDESVVEISALMHQCFVVISTLAASAGVTLVADSSLSGISLRADERALRQILLNLLSNSVKFSPNGGRVVTRAHADDDSLCIEVEDNGIGIAPEHIPLVVEPFRQAPGVRTREHRGTGLGLSISKSLARLHGGDISISSAVGVGTTVCIRLPIERLLV